MVSLEYFLIVAEELNITKAARRIHISQQSLSSYIMKLEEHYGVQLFERKPRFRLTKVGEILQEEGKKVVTLQKEIEALMFSYSQLPSREITIRVGFNDQSSTRMKRCMPIPEYCEKWLNVSFQYVFHDFVTLKQMLLDQELDIFFATVRKQDEDSQMVVVPLFAESVNIVLSKELFRRQFREREQTYARNFADGIKLNEISEIPVLIPYGKSEARKILDTYFHERSIVPVIRGEATGTDLDLELVNHHLVMLFLSSLETERVCDLMQRDKLCPVYCFPLKEPCISRETGIYYKKRRHQPGYIEDFIELAVSKNKKQQDL